MAEKGRPPSRRELMEAVLRVERSQGTALVYMQHLDNLARRNERQMGLVLGALSAMRHPAVKFEVQEFTDSPFQGGSRMDAYNPKLPLPAGPLNLVFFVVPLDNRNPPRVSPLTGELVATNTPGLPQPVVSAEETNAAGAVTKYRVTTPVQDDRTVDYAIHLGDSDGDPSADIPIDLDASDQPADATQLRVEMFTEAPQP